MVSDPDGNIKDQINSNVMRKLQLGKKDKIPFRRVVSIWNRKSWRDKITDWCGNTRLGLETFNASTYEWLSSLRIDDYFFPILDRASRTLQTLPLDERKHLGEIEWTKVAEILAKPDVDERELAL